MLKNFTEELEWETVNNGYEDYKIVSYPNEYFSYEILKRSSVIDEKTNLQIWYGLFINGKNGGESLREHGTKYLAQIQHEYKMYVLYLNHRTRWENKNANEPPEKHEKAMVDICARLGFKMMKINSNDRNNAVQYTDPASVDMIMGMIGSSVVNNTEDGLFICKPGYDKQINIEKGSWVVMYEKKDGWFTLTDRDFKNTYESVDYGVLDLRVKETFYELVIDTRNQFLFNHKVYVYESFDSKDDIINFIKESEITGVGKFIDNDDVSWIKPQMIKESQDFLVGTFDCVRSNFFSIDTVT